LGSGITEITREVTTAQAWQGPLPRPDDFHKYEAISPGSTTLILKMASDQADHRRQMESKALDAEIEDRKEDRNERRRGQRFALTIGLAALVVAALAISLGMQIAACVIGGTGAAALIGAFIGARVMPERKAGAERPKPIAAENQSKQIEAGQRSA
jgi:uncharacterized membrane protein